MWLVNPSIAPFKTLGLTHYANQEEEILKLIREEIRFPKIPKALILSRFDEVVDRNIVYATQLHTASLFLEPDWGHRVPTDERAAVEKFLIEPIRRIPKEGRELIARLQKENVRQNGAVPESYK